MGKQRRGYKWHAKKALQKSLQSHKKADRDETSWLRPGWTWKSDFPLHTVRCLGCGFEIHWDQTCALIKHEGNCAKFQSQLLHEQTCQVAKGHPQPKVEPIPRVSSSSGTSQESDLHSAGDAPPGIGMQLTSVAPNETTRRVIRFHRKVGKKVEKTQILPSTRNALKCVAADMHTKYDQEKEAAKAAGRKPAQPDIRPGWRERGEHVVDCAKCDRQLDRANFYVQLLHEQTCQVVKGQLITRVSSSSRTSQETDPHPSGVKVSRVESSSTFGGIVPGSVSLISRTGYSNGMGSPPNQDVLFQESSSAMPGSRVNGVEYFANTGVLSESISSGVGSFQQSNFGVNSKVGVAQVDSFSPFARVVPESDSQVSRLSVTLPRSELGFSRMALPPKVDMSYQGSLPVPQLDVPRPAPSVPQTQETVTQEDKFQGTELNIPQNQSYDDLTLLEHFRRCQHKYWRHGVVGDDLMSTWRMVGHNEITLRNLCREKLPSNQNELKHLLMPELDGIASLPKNHSLTDVIAETAEYFLPS